MTDDPTHRFDNGECKDQRDNIWNDWEFRFHTFYILGAFVILAVVMLLQSCRATEFTFAPHTSAAFRSTVRKVIRSRPACEAWEETAVVQFWLPAPLTFQAVKAAYITPGPLTPYADLPLTSGEIYRRGCIAAWVFRSGNRDFITVSTGIRTSKADMIADINAEIDTWLRK